MVISEKTKIIDIMNQKSLSKIGKYILYGDELLLQRISHITFEQLQPMGWNLQSISYGINHLLKTAEQKECFYPVYSNASHKEDKRKEDVNLIHFPGGEDAKDRPYIILCAGGAYSMVCSMVQSYPVAARFNELGYTAFALTYRVDNMK